MISRRNLFRGVTGSLLLPFLPSCDQTDLSFETGPIPPYVQNITTDGVSIMWESDNKTAGTVQLFESGGGQVASVEDSVVAFHEVRINNLTPGTTYFYQVRERNANIGPLRSFTTAPVNGSTERFSFIAVGDTGLGTEDQFKVADQMALLGQEASFIIHTGDVVYDGYEREYRSKFFRPYQAILHRIPFFPVIGDHDEVDDMKAWLKFFSPPINNIDGSEAFYSFRWGNALFIALNSNFLIDSDPFNQLIFLETELAKSNDTWKFVYLQHAIFASAFGREGVDFLQSNIPPIVERYGVDIVFSGDVHAYERVFPLQVATNSGTGEPLTYVVTGGGGAELRDLSIDESFSVGQSVHHFVLVTIEGTDLSLVAYDFNGNVIDTYEIDATTTQTTTTTTTTTTSVTTTTL